jgi:hypothetical protein
VIVGPGDLITDNNGRVGIIVARIIDYPDWPSDEPSWRWLVVFPDELVNTATMAGCSVAIRAR